MAKGKAKSVIVKLLSAANTGFFYTTRKNPRNVQKKLALRKVCGLDKAVRDVVRLLLLGFGYIGVGSFKYMFYILRFRQVMGTSWPSVVASCSHAAVALGIWLTATASFL
ncbi:hypothetical protein DYB38_005227, partial [Aphanomyces astaci]